MKKLLFVFNLLFVFVISIQAQTPPDTVQFIVMVDNISPLRVGQKLTLIYFANRKIDSFSEPDLSRFDVIERMEKKQIEHAIPQLIGDTVYQTWESRNYIVSVKEPGEVKFPAATAVIEGKEYICEEKTMSAISPANINDVSHQWRIEPESPKPNELFRLTITFSTKPDEAVPPIDFGKLTPVNLSPLIISDTSRPDGEFGYSFWVKGEEGGVYELPTILVHFAGKPYAIYDIKIQVDTFYERYIGVVLLFILAGLCTVLFIRKFNREGKEETAAFVIRTGKLNLDVWSAGTHFEFPIFLFFLPIIIVAVGLYYDFSSEKQNMDNSAVLWMITISAILCMIFTYIQYQRLRCKPVSTELPKEELYKIIEEVGKTRKWIFDYVGDDCVVAHTESGVLGGSGGEQIFVVFDQGKVWINSICDLNRRSSITSFGRTTEHMRVLTEAIRGRA